MAVGNAMRRVLWGVLTSESTLNLLAILYRKGLYTAYRIQVIITLI